MLQTGSLWGLIIGVTIGLLACGGGDIGDGPSSTGNPVIDDDGQVVGSGGSAAQGGGGSGGVAHNPLNTDPFAGLPRGEEQWRAMCDQGWGDPVSVAFCAATTPPSVTSLVELQRLLGIDFKPGVLDNGSSGNPAFALIGHSQSISARTVSPVNPRAIIFTPAASGNDGQSGVQNPQPNNQFIVMAYVRGESFVELISKDPMAGGALRFFLFNFDYECGDACSAGRTLTPSAEAGWVDYTLYDGDTIGNTIFDCKQCHQPSGPGTTSMLRMHELRPDWFHWFYPETDGNRDIIAAYKQVKGFEGYAGIPSEVWWNANFNFISQSQPGKLGGLVEHNGFANQPLLFPSQPIINELQGPGTTTIWDGLYAQAVAGLVPPVPYFRGLITDAAKIAAAETAYQSYLNGGIQEDQLPDIRDVFDTSLYPETSVRPAVGLDGRGILRHMCQHCHNSQLDQNISRARFNVETLDTLAPEVKSEAIARLTLPDNAAGRMPPLRYHELSQAEIDLVIAELSP